jgi:hypothetical protein
VVLYVLIPIACLAVVFLGFTMCRLASISDNSEALACAEWMATNDFDESPSADVEDGFPDDSHGSPAYRAAGR